MGVFLKLLGMPNVDLVTVSLRLIDLALWPKFLPLALQPILP